jgi:acetylornithine deacetylase/succinyl-diaminopimelate desuccinylase-like protein
MHESLSPASLSFAQQLIRINTVVCGSGSINQAHQPDE